MMYTFPNAEAIKSCVDKTPKDMYPSNVPWLVVEEGYLSPDECSKILSVMFSEETYRVKHCNATTSECSRPLNPVFDHISEFLLIANDLFWKYDLGDQPQAWMQTYFGGDDYQPHMDGSPGQTRKLTAVVMLTDSPHYAGGDLDIYIPPNTFKVPKEQGTIVVFPSWVIHQVTPVTRGIRQTINLGYWGPPFR